MREWRPRPTRLGCFLYGTGGAAARVLMLFILDLHRSAVPAAHAARLPPHLLRRVSEGVVCVPGDDGDVAASVYVPVMSRFGAVDAAQCDGYDAAGYVHTGESAPGEDG